MKVARWPWLGLMLLTGCSLASSAPTGHQSAVGTVDTGAATPGASAALRVPGQPAVPRKDAAASGWLEVVIRWPVRDRPGFRAAALPTSTRLIRLTLRDGAGVRLERELTRPADGGVQPPVVLELPPGNNLSLEVAAYRDAAGTGEPIARGTAAGLVVMSAVTTPVRLVLDALFVPTVASMSTNVGAPGDAVTLYGSHLDAVEGQLPEVRFGGSGLAEVLEAASDSLRVRLPADARVGEVSVVRDGIRWPGRGVFWPFDPNALRIESPKQSWDPRPADVRMVLQGATHSFSVPPGFWLWPDGTQTDAVGLPPLSWSVEPAALGSVSGAGQFLAGATDGTGDIRLSVGGLSASPQDIEVTRLDFSVATSSMVFDPNFGDASGTRQLGAQLRLSSGEELPDSLRYVSDNPLVCTVSATGDVLVLDFSSDRLVQVRVTNYVDGRKIAVPVEVLRDRFLRAGTFQMGSLSSESGGSSDETLHQVTLTRDFLMQATEVTQGQWRALMGNNPSYRSGTDNRPVDQVSWYDTVAYANALSARDGLSKAYDLSSCSGTPGTDSYYCDNVTLTASTFNATTGWRLPTEAEWEYAYRAGTTTPWYFGSDSNLLGTYAWFSINSGGRTQPVGQKLPNAWDLYDMAGNVWEWCWDWYGSYPGTVTDPEGSTSGYGRVFRGGSLNDVASTARAAYRGYLDPGARYNVIGFRLCRSRP